LASYVASPQWWREEYGVAIPYKTLHGIVRYPRKAKRKRPRPRQATKTRQKRLTLSNSARAASGLLQL
jgi:hypothetical protein